MKLSEIKADPNSKFDQHRIESLFFSIKDYGFNYDKPIVIDEDGWIIDGNHRFVAWLLTESDEIHIRQINYSDYETINEDFPDDDDFFESILEKANEIELTQDITCEEALEELNCITTSITKVKKSLHDYLGEV